MGASRQQNYGHRLLLGGLVAVALLLLFSLLPAATAATLPPKAKPPVKLPSNSGIAKDSSHLPAATAAKLPPKAKPPVKLPSGIAKDAWPEYRGRLATEVKKELLSSGLVKQVFIWAPSQSRSGPFYPGKPEDVWLYTDKGGDDGVVYEIPRRGLWHFNRIDPGWPGLQDVYYKDAIRTILRDYPGVRVVYGPEGFVRTKDFRTDRVFIDYDKKTYKVLGVPRVG